MPRPVILSVDDDPDVLSAIERDLRRQYAEHYRIVKAGSGKEAIDILRRLKQQDAPVALLLVDHRMPQMNGIETLLEAMRIFPDAKRVLLTAYADTDAAIRAINQVQLNHYLLKPWDPPQQQLYPVLDDLLEDWQANHPPPFDGVQLLGSRWSSQSYELRDFLARNQIPYLWHDIESVGRDPQARALSERLPSEPKLPVAVIPGGEIVEEAAPNLMAQKLGLQMRAGLDFYDVAIVGGGPAGLAAAVYGASEGLRTVMVEREAPGGQAGCSSRIENYLGFPSGLSGLDLARRAVTQARRFGVEIVSPQEATGLGADGPYRHLKLNDGSEIACHALILAMGVQWRKLDIPGLERLQGAGVYYGAAQSEAASCREETVYVIGGANSAGQAAMFFARFASSVVMLVRGPSLADSMSQYLIDQIKQTENIHVEFRTRVVEAHGEDRLQRLTLACDKTGETYEVAASSLFIFIGAEPRTAWLDGMVQRDERGFILTGRDLVVNGQRPQEWTLNRDPGLLETSVPGVFAVGDVRHGSIKRVASSVGEGSVAIQFVHQYLSKV